MMEKSFLDQPLCLLCLATAREITHAVHSLSRLGTPANSPGFPWSLHIFHEISRLPVRASNLPGTTYRGSFYISYSEDISDVMNTVTQ